MELVRPTIAHLPSYVDALKRGWSPHIDGDDEARFEELERIERNQDAFVELLDDPEAKGGPWRLPDGSSVPRLPGYKRWMWDGEFAGNIGFRWKPGTTDLPPTCLGHIGYSVVPWKRRRGYATQALRLMLPEVRCEGLPYVELTTDVGNTASQRVIIANGGVLVKQFTELPVNGGGQGFLFRIEL